MKYVVAYFHTVERETKFQGFYTRAQAVEFMASLPCPGYRRLFIDEDQAKTRATQAVAQYFDKV